LEMKRKQAFADAVKNTSIADGANIVVRALLMDLIVTPASLFDQDKKAIDLERFSLA
jgi:hypothetical protein